MGFKDLESMRQHKESALRFIAGEAADTLDAAMSDADVECESPIEAAFYLWWKALTFADYLGVRDLDLETQSTRTIGDQTYRLDFVVTPSDKEMWQAAQELGVKWQWIGIELDGHEFHEKTKEQVAYRNQRDRDLQAAGWVVLHFSGSELFRDPLSVVTEAARVATNALNKLRIGYYVKQSLRRRSESQG